MDGRKAIDAHKLSWTLHDSGGLQASGIDPEEAFRRDVFEGLIERHDDRAEVTRSSPGRSSPPQHLNLVLGGWSQAGNRVRRL
jgi:hypothetical protein